MKRTSLIFPLVLFCLFSVIVIALQHEGLDAPMYYDSAGSVLNKQQVFEQHDLSKIVGIFPQRPVPVLSFYLNYLIEGMNPRYFRLFNQLLLAATAVLLALLIEMILDLPGSWRQGTFTERRIVSAVLGLLFLIHPFQTYLTLYIWQRMALMACLFSYGSLASYLAVRAGLLRYKSLGYAGSLILFVLACLSKENAIILPAVLLLAEIAFFRADWKNLFRRGAVFGAVLIVLMGVMSLLESPHGMPEYGSGIFTVISKYYQESGQSPIQVLFTQCRVLFLYLFTIIFPTPSTVQLIRPQIVSTSILEPSETLIAVIAAASLALAGAFLLRKRPLVGFGWLFFLIALLPEAFLVPQYAFFGYRAVFPMLGLCLIAADCILSCLALARAETRRQWAYAGLISVLLITVVFWSFVTAKKAELWRTPISMWGDAVRQFPNHKNMEGLAASQALLLLGVAQINHGDHFAAAQSFLRATEVNPNYAEAHYNLGKALLNLGRIEASLVYFQKALELKSNYWQAHNNLGIALARSGRVSEAIPHFEKALAINPEDVPTRNNLQTALKELRVKGNSIE